MTRLAKAAALGLVLLLALGPSGCGKRPAGEKPAVAQGTAVAPDGVRIAYDVRGAGEPALVFVHGWCGSRADWVNQLDEFAKDYQVVALDLPGHGASGSERTEWTIPGLAADVQTVVETLGLKHMVFVGHSLGGPISLEASRLLRGRVDGVIAVETLHDAEFKLPPDAIDTMVGRFEADFTGTMARMVRSMFPATVDQLLVDRVVSTAVGTNHAAALGIMRDYRNLDLKEALRGAGVPVRCINTPPREDGGLLTNVEKNRQYADFDAVVLTGSGHYPMLDQPEAFNTKLRDWLRVVAPR